MTHPAPSRHEAHSLCSADLEHSSPAHTPTLGWLTPTVKTKNTEPRVPATRVLVLALLTGCVIVGRSPFFAKPQEMSSRWRGYLQSARP